MTRGEARVFAALMGRGFYYAEQGGHPCIRMIKKAKKDKKATDTVLDGAVSRRSDAESLVSIYNEMYYEGRRGHSSRLFQYERDQLSYAEGRAERVMLGSFLTTSTARDAAEMLNKMYKHWLK